MLRTDVLKYFRNLDLFGEDKKWLGVRSGSLPQRRMSDDGGRPPAIPQDSKGRRHVIVQGRGEGRIVDRDLRAGPVSSLTSAPLLQLAKREGP